MSGTVAPPGLGQLVAGQLRVVEALVLREMHMRYGRRDFGYIWLFIEPMILGLAIAIIHSAYDRKSFAEILVFFTIGYVLFFMFRAIVGRSTTVIRANSALLYHRRITLQSLFLARHLIEVIACVGVMAIYTTAGVAIGADWPEAPATKLFAILLMGLLAQGLAFLIAAAAQEWETLDRIIHMFTYLLMPISGVFFRVNSLPEWLQEILLWVPMVHIFELLREAQFGAQYVARYDLAYVAAWIGGLHLLGLAALRVVRRRITLD